MPEGRYASLVWCRGEASRGVESKASPPVRPAQSEPTEIAPHVPASSVKAPGGVETYVRGAVAVCVYACREPDAPVVSVYLEGHVSPGFGVLGYGYGLSHVAGDPSKRSLVIALLPLVPGTLGVLGAHLFLFALGGGVLDRLFGIPDHGIRFGVYSEYGSLRGALFKKAGGVGSGWIPVLYRVFGLGSHPIWIFRPPRSLAAKFLLGPRPVARNRVLWDVRRT